MGYDSTKNGAPDRDRINLSGDCERRYWTARFGVTLDQLQRAIQIAGPVVDDVRRALDRRSYAHALV
jgi:hypothetical protein